MGDDLLAIGISHALQYLSKIARQITTVDLLGNIFSTFCIGK
jgi:tRNA U34 5-carboxymethylaminomethyl modifying GTPase MnmE/TrmE